MNISIERFYKDEQGAAFTWIMMLIVLFLFGIVYGIIDPLMDKMHDIGVDSGIPSEQLGVEDNVWKFLPLLVLIAVCFWGLTESQRRQA